MKNKTLVLSIALNGYQWVYKKELHSHKKYAEKHGYVHQAVTRPYVTRLGVECCWLKLTLIRDALLSGYEYVLFLDADSLVKDNCPALSSALKEDKYLYMAKGYSGRFNSGVIFIKNTEETLAWLDKVINARDLTIKEENDVGWGENGHIIELSKNCSFISELSKKWNNTSDHQLNDYIRHSNYGPMRTYYLTNFFHKVVFYFSAKSIAIISNRQRADGIHTIDSLLISETQKIMSMYPRLTYT